MFARRALASLGAAFALAAATPTRAAERLGIEDAVRIALERNPELASLGAEVPAARARLDGATLLAQRNPEVSLGAGSRRTSGDRSGDLEVEVTQEVEVFGERAARIDAARAALASAEARYQARRVELAAETRETFARALAAERLLTVAREARELAGTVEAAAARRLEVGEASQIEVNSARVEVGRSAGEVAEAVRRREAALAELRLLTAIDPASDLVLAGELAPLAPLALSEGAEPSSFLAVAREQRPDLRAAREDLQAAAAERRLAGREALPKPRLGARFEREGEEDAILGTLSFDLPLLNRNQAGRGVAGARLAQAQRALEAAERRVSQEVRLALARLEAARDAARAFEGEVVRAMEENLRLVATAYQAGKIGLFELLVLRRDALDARRGRIRAQEDLVSAEAQLLRALGQEGRRDEP
jgi:cobalt-zinc-cadmium efflux system outer membrane protein